MLVSCSEYPRDKPFLVTSVLRQKPNQPFWLNRPGQLAGNSERARGILFLFSLLIFISFFKYETIVSRNGLSLGYLEQDTCSVKWHPFLYISIKWILTLPKYQLNKIWLENTLSSEPFCTSQLLQFFNFRDEMTSSLNFAIDAHVLAYWHPFVVHFLYELWPKSM